MYRTFWGLIICGLFSCGSKYQSLEKYYENNIVLHRQICDSLIEFCKQNNSKVTIRKTPVNDGIMVNYWINENSEGNAISFDSILKRKDYNPIKTSTVYFPELPIKRFNESFYQTISADNSNVFLGYKSIAFQESELGILIYKDESKIEPNNIIKRLSNEACIYKQIVP